MGTVRVGEKAEAVAERVELVLVVGVGGAALEPAEGARAAAAEDDAGLPGLAQCGVDAVDAPDGEHVRRVASQDEDDVLADEELADVAHRAVEELEVRGLADA